MADAAPGNDARENPPVRHDTTGNRFIVNVDGVDAVLDYRKDDAVMVITHTTVPSEIGGRGIADHLVRTAFEHAREQKWKVRAECSYAAVWAKRHPDYLPLLA